MWEIKCIVGDKKALEVVKLLQGHTLEPPVMVYVETAKTNGATHPKPHGNSSIDILREWLPGQNKVTAKQMCDHLMSKGYSRNGYSYSLQKLLKDGLLKKTKEYGTYEVKI